MAYVSQERKQSLAPAIKAVLKKYGVKGSLSIRTHSSLVLTIKSGKIDFIENFIDTDATKPYAKHMSGDEIERLRKNKCVDVNPYWYHEHFSGKAKNFLKEVLAAMNKGNHDNSDAMTDYFDVGWYVNVNIGRWNQPYVYVA